MWVMELVTTTVCEDGSHSQMLCSPTTGELFCEQEHTRKLYTPIPSDKDTILLLSVNEMSITEYVYTT